MYRSFRFAMAAFRLLFLVLPLAFSCNSALAATVDNQPLPQQEVCMASSSSSCPEAAVAEPLKEEPSVMYKEKAGAFFRHDGRTIRVDFVLPASNSPVAAGDEDLLLRQEAMAQAITVLSRYSRETTDEETLKWAMGVVNLEAQRWKPIFRAVNRVLESGADDRTKEEAFAQARVQLNRDLGQEGPNALKLDFAFL